jgi:hydrogenase expression/formation protein HypC
MCIGEPMQVVAGDGEGIAAVCEAGGRRERLDMMLVGEQTPGTWVLAFLGAARRVLDAEEAAQMTQALAALGQALHGAEGTDLDALFPDLAQREPELPPHLLPPVRG